MTARAGARRLPPGSHGIPADVVALNQRERLIAAMAEVCAEEGYAGASVEKVARRAGVPVAGALALIGKRVMAGEAERLPELEDELAAALSAQS